MAKSTHLAPALLLSFSLFAPSVARSQWTTQHPETTESFRALSAVGDHVVWAGGTHGTFMWTDDAGATWHVGAVPGALSLDFRAVHAVSLDTAYLMVSAQDTGRIYRTTDRGAHWTLQFRDESREVFLDGLAFFDSRSALALGDPVDGRFTMLTTRDGGAHWRRVTAEGMPPSLPGEGAFAASNSVLATCGAHDAYFATGGGPVARLFHSADRGETWHSVPTPIRAGTSAAGIFTLACTDAAHVVAAGGDYARPDTTAVTVARTSDAGATWTASRPSSALGYLSGIAWMPGRARDAQATLVGVGTAGTSISRDGGRAWYRVDDVPLNVVIPFGDGVLAAGAGGRVMFATGWPAQTSVHH